MPYRSLALAFLEWNQNWKTAKDLVQMKPQRVDVIYENLYFIYFLFVQR